MTWELTPELEQKICDLLVAGNSIRKICRINGMPSRDTIMRWERENVEFATNVAHAREAKLEDDAEELQEINEQIKAGLIPAAEANVISNNIKWTASRLLSKKYGDSTQIKHADADGNKLTFSGILNELDGRTASIPRVEE